MNEVGQGDRCLDRFEDGGRLDGGLDAAKRCICYIGTPLSCRAAVLSSQGTLRAVTTVEGLGFGGDHERRVFKTHAGARQLSHQKDLL